MADAPKDDAPKPRSKEEILADPQMRALLEPYQPIHHDLVLESYARLLADLYRNGAVYESNLEYLLHQHDKPARRYLWMIQHQKLFDLECQWRAGLVEVPEARLTADFDDWHNYIEECTVLPPITPDEVELLGEFIGQITDGDDLSQGSPCEMFWMHRQFPQLRRDNPEEEEEETLNAFTQFWDLRRGTGYLRQLPDLRGPREQHYTEAVRQQHREKRRAAPPEPRDPRPQAPTYGPEHDELMRDWLRRFEPAARLRQFETKLQLEAFDASEDRLDLPLALERLQNAGPVRVPIEAHADWRQAVIAAGHRHYLDQLRAALPHAYDDYCQRQELGISHEPPADTNYHQRGGSYKHLAEQIREGRRLLGEPDDLDF